MYIQIDEPAHSFSPSSLDYRSTELIVSPKKVVWCMGGSRNVEGCWGVPHLKIEKLPNCQFMFSDRCEFHIHQKTWNGNLPTFLFSSKGAPSTPQHSDSHPCTRPPSWGTQWTRWNVGKKLSKTRGNRHMQKDARRQNKYIRLINTSSTSASNSDITTSPKKVVGCRGGSRHVEG